MITGLLVAPGTRTRVRVPATSANLGPGFDCLGLALALHDEVEVEVLPGEPGVEIEVLGEGRGQVPLDERHLVARMVRAGLARAGAEAPRLRLRCHNRIPHGRGLGSSSAAAVAGLLAARGLLTAHPQQADALSAEVLFDLATDFEGHPDNAAATVFGGLTIAWTEAPGRARAVNAPVDPQVRAVVCVPTAVLATERARAMLPPTVDHADAAFTAGRSALLIEALSRRPDLLLPATADRLHQHHRAAAMPATAALVAALRERGAAAVVSGAGPSVLVLGTGDEPAAAVRAVLGEGASAPVGSDWQVLSPEIDTQGAGIITDSI